jgi:hypothetical protein
MFSCSLLATIFHSERKDCDISVTPPRSALLPCSPLYARSGFEDMPGPSDVASPALAPSLRDFVTVVITTSPVVSHPSLSLLETTLASFVYAQELWAVRKVIVADGCRMQSAVASGAVEANPSGRRKYRNPSKAMRSGYVKGPFADHYAEFKVRSPIMMAPEGHDMPALSTCSSFVNVNNPLNCHYIPVFRFGRRNVFLRAAKRILARFGTQLTHPLLTHVYYI